MSLLPAFIAVAQNSAKKSASTVLSASFTTSALKCLRLINTYDGSPAYHVASTGAAEKDLLASLDAVQDEARSNGEMRVVSMLNSFFAGKVKNNDARQRRFESSWDAWKRTHPGADEEFVAQARGATWNLVLLRDSTREMADHEAACRDPFDSMLRSGRFHTIPPCDDVAVSTIAEEAGMKPVSH